jgi:hypothetical protein
MWRGYGFAATIAYVLQVLNDLADVFHAGRAKPAHRVGFKTLVVVGRRASAETRPVSRRDLGQRDLSLITPPKYRTIAVKVVTNSIDPHLWKALRHRDV